MDPAATPPAAAPAAPAPTPAATLPAPAAAPQPPPAGQDPQLSGKAALALFQDLPATEPSKQGEPAKVDAPPVAPAAEPAKGGQDPELRKAWTKLAEGQAELRRQAVANQQLIDQAKAIVERDKAIQQDPTKLLELYGPDLAEKLVLARRGDQPKTAEEQLAELQAWKAEQERLRGEQARDQQQAQQQAAVAAEVELVTGWMKEAGNDRYETLLNMPVGADGLTGPQKVHKAFTQFYMPRNGYDPQQHPESTTKEILLRIGDEIEKQETEGLATAVGKVKKVASRFAPAPAAAAPAAPQTQAPPTVQTPPAPAAPAPPTLNGRHAGDAAPPASRRKSLKDLDEEIAARFWPS